MAGLNLPKRQGAAPDVIGPQPHGQRSQNAPLRLQTELVERALNLPGVSEADSLVSVPGARAFMLDSDLANGPDEAYQKEREFAHIHPPEDGSLHMTLPPSIAEEAFQSGWGEPHPKSGTPLIFGPRNEAELEVVWTLLKSSYEFAAGK